MLCRFSIEGEVNTGFDLRVFDVASGGGRKVGACREVTKADMSDLLA